MAGRGLLTRLRQTRGGETQPRTLKRSTVEDVLHHLRAILNTRKGEAPSAPELGVLCLTDLLHAFPGAVGAMQRSIKETIVAWEPRLKNVTVRHIPGEDPLTLSFEISGVLEEDGGRVRFSSRFSPQERVAVW